MAKRTNAKVAVRETAISEEEVGFMVFFEVFLGFAIRRWFGRYDGNGK
jgi:hypothetical protein